MNDYSAVTETPEVRITREALGMLLARYGFAAQLCKGRDVLEVACGPGGGLGYLLRNRARRVVGGDITASLVRAAGSHYGSRIPVLQFDAQALPFRAATFDLLLLYEALYYLEDQGLFLGEAARVLRTGGQLVVSSVNCEWRDFNPSSLSTRYLSARQLQEILAAHGFRARIYAGFTTLNENRRDKLVSLIKRAAIAAHLIPRTMNGKQSLKRLFLGPMRSAPHELTDEIAEYCAPIALDELDGARDFKVLYAVGVRQ
jgi:SAM-dependent methyltransferase